MRSENRRALALFVTGALVGTAGVLHATVACEPTTHYALVATSLTTDGQPATLPRRPDGPYPYELKVSNEGNNTTFYYVYGYDPTHGARTLQLQGAP